MRKLLILAFVLTSSFAFGQAPNDWQRTPRGFNTIVDYFLKARSLQIPHHNAFGLYGAQDSIGHFQIRQTDSIAGFYMGNGTWVEGTKRSEATVTVGSISALQSYSGQAVSIFVGGLQGGLFRYSLAAQTANGGTVLTAVGKGAGYWVRQYTGAIQLVWFGADNSGATDCSTQFQNAINAIPQGGTLDIGAGTFLLTSSVHSNNPYTRITSSNLATIKYQDSYNIAILLQHDYVEVDHVVFTTTNAPTPSSGAIYIQGAWHCHIHDLTINGPAGNGIALYAGSCYKNGVSGTYGPSYNEIEHCTINGQSSYTSDSNDYAAIFMGYADHIFLVGNNIHDNTLNGKFALHYGVSLIGSGYQNTVHHNNIINFLDYGVLFYQMNVDHYEDDKNEASFNTIGNIGSVAYGNHNKGMGIYLQQSYNAIVVGNHVFNTEIGANGSGTLVQSAIGGVGCIGGTISDNIIDTVATNCPGIRVSNSVHMIVHHNRINYTYGGINFQNNSYSTVDHNIIISSRAQGINSTSDTAAYSGATAGTKTGIANIYAYNIISGLPASQFGMVVTGTTVSPVHNNEITGNVIQTSGSGIQTNAHRTTIMLNQITGVSGTGNAIEIDAPADSNMVMNNYISRSDAGVFNYGIYSASVSDYLRNNDIYGVNTEIYSNSNTQFAIRRTVYMSAVPATGTWMAGDRVYNSTPTSTVLGWVCTSGGTPGTWVTMNNLSATVDVNATANTVVQRNSLGSINTVGLNLTGSALMTPSQGEFGIAPSAYSGQYKTNLAVQSGAMGVLTFGNNDVNDIRAGRNFAGGKLRFWVNNTVDYSSASDGLLALTLSNTGAATFGYGVTAAAFAKAGGTATQELMADGSTTPKVTGTATLVAGTVTVANTSVTSNAMIFISRKTVGGTAGFIAYTVTAGTSFTITSSSNTDTSVVNYLITAY